MERSCQPVHLDWTSVKVKVLGVVIALGNLEELNWHPRIDAVDHLLSSWRARSLSFSGKALVINALALSPVWYVAALIHLPPWVLKELNSLPFKFFWSGKRDLVFRAVVVQPVCSGGFSDVDVKLKVWALLAQWVRRFVSFPSDWTSFMSYWFKSCFDATPTEVFSTPFAFNLRFLPPFYKSWF